MKKQTLRSYAKLLARVGANVQKDQDVIIYASVDDAYFVKYVVEECYKAKAREVTVEWTSDEISKLKYKYEKTEVLTDFPEWRKAKLQHQVDTLPATIYIVSNDPDAMAGIDQDKMANVRRVIGPLIKSYRDKMDNKYQWTIAGIPGEAWAKKVFPELSTKKAIDALWDAILKVTRVNGNPVLNWCEHNLILKEKCYKLNNLGIKKLKYHASNGTDFEIEIQKELQFLGGSEDTYSKVTYQPNMPTEECFTSPKKDTANGIVMASKPLSVMGNVVKDFGFRFENGKVVEVLGKDNDKAILEKLISLDEGARRLGEVALVPFDSPVNQTGLLFYETLYDENACCHLALGRAFDECIRDYQNLSEEEIKKIDLNDSMIHVDFMIGTADLNIVAETYDGKTVQIFKDGTWAI